MRDIQRGDMIRVKRGLYDHYGIYVGNNRVIHYSGSLSGKLTKEPRVEEVSLRKFLDGAESYQYYVDDENGYSADETIRRARRLLGEEKYDLVFRNCEHFARWCRTGEDRSYQVENVLMTAGAALLGWFATGGTSDKRKAGVI